MSSGMGQMTGQMSSIPSGHLLARQSPLGQGLSLSGQPHSMVNVNQRGSFGSNTPPGSAPCYQTHDGNDVPVDSRGRSAFVPWARF